jgi:hypothetical protein
MDSLPNGAIHVRNPTTGAWSDRERWHIVEELRIGNVEGGPEQFGDIVAVAGTPDGLLLVADGFTQQIRVFDGNGAYLRTLGHRGSGPGELARISGVVLDRDGRIWVADPGNARYTLFDASGTHVGHRPIRIPGQVLPWLGGFRVDGRLFDAAPLPEPDGRLSFRLFLSDSATGQVVDSFPAITSTRPRPEVPMAVFTLIPRLTFRFDPAGYVWFGTTDRYRIVRRSLSGDTVRMIELDRSRVAVSESEKDSIMRLVMETPQGSPPLTRRDIPGVKPFFERIYLDDAGHVIVQPNVSVRDQGRIFDVFDVEGRYLGEAVSNVSFVTLPVLPRFQNGKVLGVTVDSVGVQYVVRARIEKGRG